MSLLFDQLTAYCGRLLRSAPEARQCAAYLDERLPREAQTGWGFGYFPDVNGLNGLIDSVGLAGLTEMNLIYEQARHDGEGVVRETHSQMERHNLLIPYRDVYGEVIGIACRTLMSDAERAVAGIPKYKNTRFDKGRNLFGLYEARREIVRRDEVMVVEGQFDCIAAHTAGMTNVVALGSSSMTFSQATLLLRYTQNLTLLLDGDPAGKMGMEKIREVYGPHARIRTARLPAGAKDLYELLQWGGPGELVIEG